VGTWRQSAAEGFSLGSERFMRERLPNFVKTKLSGRGFFEEHFKNKLGTTHPAVCQSEKFFARNAVRVFKYRAGVY
jgi:hypothetical protein